VSARLRGSYESAASGPRLRRGATLPSRRGISSLSHPPFRTHYLRYLHTGDTTRSAPTIATASSTKATT
jgi:hypothetical protein